MNKLDLIIDALEKSTPYLSNADGIIENLDEHLKSLAAARELRDMKPVVWGIEAESGEIIDCITPALYLKKPGDYAIPLYALGESND